MFITRKELSLLDGEHWINNVVCIILFIIISYVVHFI